MNSILNTETKRAVLITIGAIALSFLVGIFTIKLGITAFFISTIAVAGVVLLFAVFKNPKIGFIGYMIYCFLIFIFLRHYSQFPFGPFMEVFLGITWLAILANADKYKWSNLKNDHCLIALLWFVINILEVFNPAGASLLGWLNEIRFTSLNWLIIAPLPFLLFNSKRDLNFFIIIVISVAVFTALYGAKQLHYGLSESEQRWLDDGGAITHIVIGKLRIFSTYSDAGQFGASQAHIGLMALILAFGPFLWWKRAFLGLAAIILFYGMLISGTRGALFVLVSGGFLAIFLSKSIKTLIVGTILSLMLLSFLKFSTYGNGNYEIRRLRTALDSEDPSLNTRFINQAKLKEALANMPFGGGVGITGINGEKYNAGKYLASIPPDSYWVKIWVMYGVVGLTIWFSMITFLIGKCCGIVWNLKDPRLKIKAMALTAGVTGLFISSYGNEVMNGLPSSIIMFMSISYVFLTPKLDDVKIDNRTYV